MTFQHQILPFEQAHRPGPLPPQRLKLLKLSFKDFQGIAHHDGTLVVMDVVAADIIEIFRALYAQNFPIKMMKEMSAFAYDDEKSMAANNTSVFNPRLIVGDIHFSLHAYGAAIDINPRENPFVKKGSATPHAGAEFIDRNDMRPGMVEGIRGLLHQHGFTIWGGNWVDYQDYHHFSLPRRLAEQLAELDFSAGCMAFESHKKMAQHGH